MKENKVRCELKRLRRAMVALSRLEAQIKSECEHDEKGLRDGDSDNGWGLPYLNVRYCPTCDRRINDV